jgi:hypothetical protein
MHGILESFSSHGEREEAAQTALLVEGATQAPVIERNGVYHVEQSLHHES